MPVFPEDDEDMEVDINTAGNDDGGQENTDPAHRSQDDHETEGSAEDSNSNDDVHVITGLDDIVEAQSHNEALPSAEEDQDDQPVNDAGNIEGKELIETFGKIHDLTILQYHFTVVKSSLINAKL